MFALCKSGEEINNEKREKKEEKEERDKFNFRQKYFDILLLTNDSVTLDGTSCPNDKSNTKMTKN